MNDCKTWLMVSLYTAFGFRPQELNLKYIARVWNIIRVVYIRYRCGNVVLINNFLCLFTVIKKEKYDLFISIILLQLLIIDCNNYYTTSYNNFNKLFKM